DARPVRPVGECRRRGGARGDRQGDPRDSQQPKRNRTSQDLSVHVRTRRSAFESRTLALRIVRGHADRRRVAAMTAASPRLLVPGLPPGIGSLPHPDARVAAEVVLRCLPELPAAPQLPSRDAREGLLAQWLGALPEVIVAEDGTITVTGVSDARPECV